MSVAPIRLATRGSPLALAQANLVLAQCRERFPEISFELRIIKTTGDKLQTQTVPADELAKGLFTKEIEDALLAQEADLAVHSLKDLPTELPPGLRLGAVTRRADARDVLIYRDLEFLVRNADAAKPVLQTKRGFRSSLSLRGLPGRATVATGSPRRSSQVLEQRPDLVIAPIRGNVGTRLQKIAENPSLDATVLAMAGLERLGLRIAPGGMIEGAAPVGLAATPLSFAEMLPCVGQGAIGLEIRQNDPRLETLCAALDDTASRLGVTAERSFLHAMGGGCQVPVAAHAVIIGDRLLLRAASFLGGKPQRGQVEGNSAEAVRLGEELARTLRDAAA